MRIEAPVQAQIPQLLSLWKAAFGEHDGFWELFLDTAFSPEHCRCILEEDTVTAALCWMDTECGGQKMAYIYAVVTAPAHRGQGLCRTLLADTHDYLGTQGYGAALLVPAEEGLRKMYRKLGYETCTTVREFSCEASSGQVSLWAIGPDAYGKLRRAMLPEAGVLQEGRSLDFLGQQAQLYWGGGFLMAAYTEGDTLHAMELLGDDTAAPAITEALGCARGVFRTPGEGKPFAMWHPLRKDAVLPGYFGFAFD